MRRRQLFEFNDLPWVPAALRDEIVESLSRLLRWGRVLRGLVGPFRAFLARTGSSEVLDLCSGAGGPAAILIDEIRRAGGAPPRFVLTDLFPRAEAWEAVRAGREEVLSYRAEPVDATHVPEELGRAHPRTVVNAFHHFPPDLARAILADAVDAGAGVFVSEAFDRNPLRMLSIAPAGIPAIVADPLFARRQRLARALFTWLLPLAPLAGTWDGVVSTLRVYTEAELREMVEPLGDRFDWVYGTYRFAPFGLATYFYGTPASGRGS